MRSSRLRAPVRKFGAKRLVHSDPSGHKWQSQTGAQVAGYQSPCTLFLIVKAQWDLLEKVCGKSFQGEEKGSVLEIYLCHNSFHSVCSDFYLSDFNCNTVSYCSPKTFCGTLNISLAKRRSQCGNLQDLEEACMEHAPQKMRKEYSCYQGFCLKEKKAFSSPNYESICHFR